MNFMVKKCLKCFAHKYKYHNYPEKYPNNGLDVVKLIHDHLILQLFWVFPNLTCQDKRPKNERDWSPISDRIVSSVSRRWVSHSLYCWGSVGRGGIWSLGWYGAALPLRADSNEPFTADARWKQVQMTSRCEARPVGGISLPLQCPNYLFFNSNKNSKLIFQFGSQN